MGYWWIDHLKHVAQTDDKNTFKEWEQKKIRTEDCIYMFKKHNMIPDDLNIVPSEFVLWLNSIGYIRR